MKIYIKHITLLVLSISLLAACKTSEPYQRSLEQTQNLYRDTLVQDSATMATMSWNELFTDARLQLLINEGLQNNSDLQIAVARIKQAQANFNQSRLAQLPSLSANGDVILNKQGSGSFNETYDVSLGASWELDIWGKNRGTKRAYKMVYLKSEAYQRTIQTQLVANIANYYYTLMALDEKLKITEQTVKNCITDVETMKLLKESNVVTGAAVVQSEAQRYSAEVTIPELKQSIRETENSLCALLGRTPGKIERSLLNEQNVAVDLKIGVPAQLLAYRPDVQEAELTLRYYAEMTNVARTYFYPSLTLTAEAGYSAGEIAQLFDASALFANIIGGLTQPIFNQGKNKQRLAVAKAQKEEYMVAFKQSLLDASVEVSNALYDYHVAEDKMVLRAQQITYLEKSVEYTRELLKYTSATNYTDVLTSEQSLLSAQLSSVNDHLQQLQAVVTLYRSLGGGWK